MPRTSASPTVVDAPVLPKRGPGRPRKPGESLEDSRKRKESALADMRQMEARKRAGDLVPARDVERMRADENRVQRSRLLAVPSRVRARCPELSRQQVDTIDREIRDALLELAADDEQEGVAV